MGNKLRLYLTGYLLLVALLSACTAPAPPLTPSTVVPQIFPTNTSAPAPTETPVTFAWEAAYGSDLVESQRTRGTNISGASEYHLDLTLSDNLLQLTGRETVNYTNRAAVPLREVEFHLLARLIGGDLQVSNVAVAGTPVQERYAGALDSLLIVPLAAPLPVGQSVKISIDFTLKIPGNPQTSYGVLASIRGVATLAHVYPLVAVYQNGWDQTVPSPYGDLTFTDVAFYTVTVTAPKDVMLIATGVQRSSQTNATTQTVQFSLGPAHDFMLTAARNYTVQSQKVGEITVNSYAPANLDQQYAQTALETAVQAIQIYSQRYAPYPYTELNIVATPTFALGVEYPGLVAIADNLYTSNAPPYYLESTVAHEVGHQWFYNLVGDDQLNQPWLDESLAQFVTWQYYADRYGEANAQDFKASLEDRWYSVDNQPLPVGKPVAAYDQKQYSAIVYGRGALFFFALRDQIGQEAFDVFLKSYTDKYTWGIATTEGIEASAGQACSCDVTPLFKEWIIP